MDDQVVKGSRNYWTWTSFIIGLGLAAAIVRYRHLRLENPRVFYFILLPVAAHMFHQFEEYAVPGGFRAFFNRLMTDGRSAERPLTALGAGAFNSAVMPALFAGAGLVGTRLPVLPRPPAGPQTVGRAWG